MTGVLNDADRIIRVDSPFYKVTGAAIRRQLAGLRIGGLKHYRTCAYSATVTYFRTRYALSSARLRFTVLFEMGRVGPSAMAAKRNLSARQELSCAKWEEGFCLVVIVN